jgi:hypothetical protein
MNPSRVLPAAVSLAVVLTVSGGCASADNGLQEETAAGQSPSAGWTEPGWMAQVRQEDEIYQAGMMACYAEYGLSPVTSMGGGVGFVNLPDDEATSALMDKASADCNARIPLPSHTVNKALDDAAYQKMLDTRACIVAHGYEVPDPPSAETWKDSPMFDAWNPYQFLTSSAVPDSELFALDIACPQAGPNTYVRAPTGDLP